MFSVSSPCVPPPLPCSRDYVTEVAFTAQSVRSFPYFQHVLMDVSIWLYAWKICLQCIPFVPGVSQLVYQLLPVAVRKHPRRAASGRKAIFWPTIQEHSPSLWGNHGGRNSREGAQQGFTKEMGTGIVQMRSLGGVRRGTD